MRNAGYEIVLEMLRGKTSIAQITRNHRVSDAVLHRWRGRFFEGGKAALEFDGEAAIRQRIQQEALERKIEELQTVIGEQVVEIRFLKNCRRPETLAGRDGSGVGRMRTESRAGDDIVGDAAD